ncbi:hypothetical protein VNO77_20148 [Canavalia gladiata]|uniref:Uncharacterized protein n=1 Tax=Canavalia gladiata TaxID=3824 RepID=A0AAN9LNY1_CANGL
MKQNRERGRGRGGGDITAAQREKGFSEEESEIKGEEMSDKSPTRVVAEALEGYRDFDHRGDFGCCVVVGFGDPFNNSSDERYKALPVIERVLHVLPKANTAMAWIWDREEKVFSQNWQAWMKWRRKYYDNVEIQSKEGMLASLSLSIYGNVRTKDG